MKRNDPPFTLPGWAAADLLEIRKIVKEVLPEPVRPLWKSYRHDFPDRASFPVRPLLVLLAARHFGCTGTRPVQLAASVQMVYLSSLFHDRLGLETETGTHTPDFQGDLHQRESLDILLGDLCFSRASCMIVEDGDARIIEDMIRTSLASAENKATIVTLRAESGTIQPGACFERVSKKTSLLVALSSRVGALVGNAGEETLKAFSDYGFALGQALTIAGDLLFWESLPDEIQRLPPETPFNQPLLLLWEKQGRAAWEEAVAPLSEAPSPELLHRVKGDLLQGGYLEAARVRAQECADRAADCLVALEKTEEAAMLDALARVHLGGETLPLEGGGAP